MIPGYFSMKPSVRPKNVIGSKMKIKPNGIHLTEIRSHEVWLCPCRNSHTTKPLAA
jgi:hypothetical protein